MKTCTRCRRERPLTDFTKDSRTKDGLGFRCSECRRAYNSERSSVVRERSDSIVIPAERRCPGCKTVKPSDDFYRARSKHNGLSTYCKACTASYHRGLRYGITVEEHDARVELQGGRCAICQETAMLMVDHCHTSGKVRGLLCFNCNGGLGQFKDNPDYLRAAIEYLQ